MKEKSRTCIGHCVNCTNPTGDGILTIYNDGRIICHKAETEEGHLPDALVDKISAKTAAKLRNGFEGYCEQSECKFLEK